MRDRVLQRGVGWSMVQVLVRTARLAEIEERAAAEGRGFGDVVRDGVDALFADESDEEAAS